jgi:hypothetical protein
MAMINQYIKNSLYAAVLLSLASACEPEIDREKPSYEEARGEADFSTYVALGNSLTAGYADNALYRESQLNSYPAIIAEKMAYITPDFEFNQPLMPEGNGVGFAGGVTIGRIQLASTDPVQFNITSPSPGWENPLEGTFHNLGVPGAEVRHLLAPGYGNPAQGQGNFNPYFARFAASPETSVIQQAISLNPTFFTLWIGNNDVLGYALAGGAGDASITDPGDFRTHYRMLIQSLTAARPGIEGAIANIPDVSMIPYVSFIRYNQLVLTAEQASLANQIYAAQIDPQVRAGVDSVAKTRVIRGVIETGTRQRIKAEVRPAVAPAVAESIVYQQAYDQAKSQGATDQQAEAIAQAYVESPEGQQQIDQLETALLNNEASEEAQIAYELTVQNQVDTIFNSENVQNQVDATYEAAINDMDNLESVLGPEGAAAVETVFNSEEVVAQREEGFNQQLEQLKAAGFYPQFQEGPNPFVMVDDNPQNPLGIRQMREGERILISAQIQGQLSPETAALPKEDRFILDAQELGEISDAIEAYNDIIAEITEENTFALLDVNSFFYQFDQTRGGYTEAGTTFSNAFITGNSFSLDGVHLTQKGAALVAKRFIETINTYYGSQIPEPSLRNYPAVGLPR